MFPGMTKKLVGIKVQHVPMSNQERPSKQQQQTSPTSSAQRWTATRETCGIPSPAVWPTASSSILVKPTEALKKGLENTLGMWTLTERQLENTSTCLGTQNRT